MGLRDKKAVEVEIKSDGYVFHELYSQKPYHVSNLIPQVHSCKLLEGCWGAVGSVISWEYFHDGSLKVAKEIITEISEEEKLITFKVIEADLLEVYKTFFITLHVDTKGGGNSLVTWTFEYEKLNDAIPDPNDVLDLFRVMTKGIESQLMNMMQH